jgi:hypothetical protein
MSGWRLACLTLVLVIGGMPLGPDQVAWAVHEQIVTATYVQKAPIGLDDEGWQSVQAVQLSLNGGGVFPGRRATVTTKAVYTDDSLYLRFRWDDPTRSVTYKAWKFDGEKWSHSKDYEDRITLLFEISRIHKFATKGCVVTCHGPGYAPKKEWTFATKTSTEIGDLWDWRAAGSDPYKYAVDNYLTVAGYWGGWASSKKTGRRQDAGNGGAIQNQTADKSKPRYMPDPSKKPSAPGFLLRQEAVKITDYSIFKAGDVIPFLLPKKPTGSRFDVQAVSRYANGGWTVMLCRKLDTGHHNDVVFNPLKQYSFAMALFDDSVDNYSKANALGLHFSR